MYKCTKCHKEVIVLNSEIIRACPVECASEPIVASAEATMTGQGGLN